MIAFLERVLLFALSILLIHKNQVDYEVVCLILLVVIAEATMLYFRKRKPIACITALFVLVSMFLPNLSVFFPLFVFECVLYEVYYLIPIQFLVGLLILIERLNVELFSKSTYSFLVFMCIAFFVGLNEKKNQKLSEKIHKMQDETSYLLQSNKQNKEELLIKQDNEIHMATLAERNRIAREIHDHVGHMLSRSILQLGAILAVNKDEKLQELLRGLKDTLDTAMNNIRESVHDLKDDSLDVEYMLKDVIKQYNSLDIHLDYDMSPYLTKELKYCLVAITKEALTNTAKHSDSTKVNIVMREHPAIYQVLIEDNGSNSQQAIDKLLDVKAKKGIGIENIKERVSAFGGNVRFTGENGFKIFISIPKKEV